MKFVDLDPTLLVAVPAKVQIWEPAKGDDLSKVDGVVFLCPKCKAAEKRAVHSIMCWTPRVAADFKPGPGRWAIHGTSLQDITLKGVTSDSVQITGGCAAHFFVRNGEIVFA